MFGNCFEEPDADSQVLSHFSSIKHLAIQLIECPLEKT